MTDLPELKSCFCCGEKESLDYEDEKRIVYCCTCGASAPTEIWQGDRPREAALDARIKELETERNALQGQIVGYKKQWFDRDLKIGDYLIADLLESTDPLDAIAKKVILEDCYRTRKELAGAQSRAKALIEAGNNICGTLIYLTGDGWQQTENWRKAVKEAQG